MAAMTLGERTPERLDRLRAALETEGLSGLVIHGDGTRDSAGHIRYLVGWMPAASEVLMIVPVDGDAILISADKNRARAFAQVAGGGIRVVKAKSLVDSFASELAGAVPSGHTIGLAGTADLGSVASERLVAVLAEYGITSADSLLAAERSRRGAYEAEMHRASTRIADAMVQHAMRIGGVAGITGAEIMAEVEMLGRRLGAQSAGCWLAFGEAPQETYFELFELAQGLRRGERLQIGTTVLADGYFSQVLRIGVLGEPSTALGELADSLIRVQDSALAQMVPGTRVTAIGDALEAGIDALTPWRRSDDPFRFQSCHAMGNSYSEPWSAPYLFADRDRTRDAESPTVEVGQTYEIHPNFTSADLGHICAGDVALVTDAGGEWISSTPRGILRVG